MGCLDSVPQKHGNSARHDKGAFIQERHIRLSANLLFLITPERISPAERRYVSLDSNFMPETPRLLTDSLSFRPKPSGAFLLGGVELIFSPRSEIFWNRAETYLQGRWI